MNTCIIIILLLNLSFLITNVAGVGMTNKNYYDYEYTTIYNIQNNCRYCKTFETTTKYSFNQCSLIRNDKQRFFILRGRNNCSLYSIMNSQNPDTFLTYQNNPDFEIISANISGGVVIKVPNQNLCLTNNLTDNLIYPYEVTEIQLFKVCSPYNSDETQVFYFWQYIIESFNTLMCRTQTTSYLTFRFFETSKGVYENSGLVADNTNINITGPYSYDYNVQTLNTASFSMFIEFGTYTVNLNLKDTHFYIYNPFAINIVSNITPAIDINIIEKINNVTFSIVNFFSSVALTTDYFVPGSNIIFTNSFDLVDWTYTVVPGNSTFQIWLRWGTYANIQSTQIADWEQNAASFTISITSFTDTSFTLMLDQKILVTFTMKNLVTSASLTTSTFQSSTNINFTRYTSAIYNYPVNAGGEATFQLYLFLGTHNLTSSDHFEWTRMTNSINIATTSDNAFDILMKENTAHCYFYFQVQNLSNANSDTCLFNNGSNIDFILPSTRVVTVTVPGGCVAYFEVDLFLGTWSINTYTLSNSTLYHMYLISGQTFLISDYTNKNFYIKFNKLFEKVIYQYKILSGSPASTPLNVHGYNFDCGSSYVITYFQAFNRKNDGLSFWIFCKQIKDNVTQTSNTGFQSSGFSTNSIYWFDRQSIICSSNSKAIQQYNHEVSGNDIRTTFTCVDLPSPVDSSCSDNLSDIYPDVGNGSMFNYHLQFYGNGKFAIVHQRINNDNWIAVGHIYRMCKFYNIDPYGIHKFRTTSSSFPNSFKNLAQNNNSCPSGYGMIFYAHALHGNYHENLIFCRELQAGYYSNLQTLYTSWQSTGGELYQYYDRHDTNCGTSKVIKSRNIEYNDGTQEIRVRYECYDYTFPNYLSSLIHVKGDCGQDSNVLSLAGFTYGDGTNFLSRMFVNKDHGGSNVCATYYNVLLPLR